jgi:hypothetical protein
MEGNLPILMGQITQINLHSGATKTETTEIRNAGELYPDKCF